MKIERATAGRAHAFRPTGEPRLLRESDKEMLWRRGSVPYKWISTSWKTNC